MTGNLLLNIKGAVTDVFFAIVGTRTFFVITVVVAGAVAAIEADAFGNRRHDFFVGIEPPTRLDKIFHISVCYGLIIFPLHRARSYS